jgi:transcriptional regulator NrdR family protein
MAKQVIKRDGTKEDFDGEKIRKTVEVAAISSGLSEDRAKEVVFQVLDVVLNLANSKEEIATKELGDAIYNELKKMEPKTAEAWRNYEEEKLRNTDNPYVSRGNPL